MRRTRINKNDIGGFEWRCRTGGGGPIGMLNQIMQLVQR